MCNMRYILMNISVFHYLLSRNNWCYNRGTNFSNFRGLLTLAQLLYDSYIPLVTCTSYGMVGHIRIVAHEHTSKLIYYFPWPPLNTKY